MGKHSNDIKKSRKLYIDRMDRKAKKEMNTGISFRQAISKVFHDGKRFR